MNDDEEYARYNNLVKAMALVWLKQGTDDHIPFLSPSSSCIISSFFLIASYTVRYPIHSELIIFHVTFSFLRFLSSNRSGFAELVVLLD